MENILKEILEELKQLKIDSLKPDESGSKRTGDYRIGLTHAENIVNGKLIDIQQSKIDLNKLEQKLDNVLNNESKESLSNFIASKRK